MLLLELIARKGLRTDKDDEAHAAFEHLEDVEVFHIQNVADYYDEHMRGSAFSDFRKSFPNVAPPFERFWMEFNLPPDSVSARRAGCMFLTLSTEAGLRQDGTIIAYLADGGYSTDTVLTRIKWVMIAVPVFEGADGGVAAPIVSYVLALDQNGALIPPDGFDKAAVPLAITKMGHRFAEALVSAGNYASKSDALMDAAQLYGIDILGPCLLAIAFTHAKNVGVHQERRVESRQQRRLRERTGECEPTKYHTLEITPMKRVLEREGQLGKSGLRHALHIVRGHFAHYTPEHPLFGKFVGTVWREAHVRGSVSEGVVDKDYSVTPARKRSKGREVPV